MIFANLLLSNSSQTAGLIGFRCKDMDLKTRRLGPFQSILLLFIQILKIKGYQIDSKEKVRIIIHLSEKTYLYDNKGFKSIQVLHPIPLGRKI